MQNIDIRMLKEMRKLRKFSTNQIAKTLGKSRTTVWRYEKGVTDIPMRLLCKLVDLYGVHLVDVLKDDKMDS